LTLLVTPVAYSLWDDLTRIWRRTNARLFAAPSDDAVPVVREPAPVGASASVPESGAAS
jgi:hypothetical protein